MNRGFEAREGESSGVSFSPSGVKKAKGSARERRSLLYREGVEAAMYERRIGEVVKSRPPFFRAGFSRGLIDKTNLTSAIGRTLHESFPFVFILKV